MKQLSFGGISEFSLWICRAIFLGSDVQFVLVFSSTFSYLFRIRVVQRKQFGSVSDLSFSD